MNTFESTDENTCSFKETGLKKEQGKDVEWFARKKREDRPPIQRDIRGNEVKG